MQFLPGVGKWKVRWNVSLYALYSILDCSVLTRHEHELKLKRNCDKASCFRPLCMNRKFVRQMFTYTDRTICFIWMDFISITYFTTIWNSMRMLYKISSLLIQITGFLEAESSWCTVPLCFRFFSSIWWKQDIWSVVHQLCRNPHWWSPIIPSTHGVNDYRRMLYKCLHVDGDINL
jgi:hypothetical protein